MKNIALQRKVLDISYAGIFPNSVTQIFASHGFFLRN